MNMSLFPNSRGVCEEWKNKHPHSQGTAGNTVSFSKGHFSVKARGERSSMGKSYIVEKGNLPMDEGCRGPTERVGLSGRIEVMVTNKQAIRRASIQDGGKACQ